MASPNNKQRADQLKLRGNEAYKLMDFATAEGLYKQASTLDKDSTVSFVSLTTKTPF